jgi:predicted ribosome quality control (RQC) complex YloA/Tae2 family protein
MLANSESFDELSDIRAELRAEMPSGTTSKTGSKEQVDPKFPPSAYMGGKPASKKSLRARANAAKSKSAAGKGGKGDPSGARDVDRSEEAGLTRPIQRVSPSGRRIMIGRNSRQNERLTLRDAAPEDMWFHVKNAPGSHVVLKLKESGVNTASDADIESAAALAAYYSSQRSGSKVDVDYTAVKNVKKIPGGKPGMVTYTNFKTITVKPADI